MHATVVPLQRGRRRIARVPIRKGYSPGGRLGGRATRGVKKEKQADGLLLAHDCAGWGNQRQMRLLSLLL